ncbi:MAG: hypothetical protein A3C43_12395 [Candidatus Schekmanbacteria bacterium RIFCSPHIGHO2_02_FULL_38_11]|nr:MAG: hypothetical protein A3C43_12395 [Candidatus Schekmanbacteria bacterium RIFCSPHIGHO2_02_FULL_38_11]
MVRPFLGQRVFELGAGTGRFSRFLLNEKFPFLLLLEPSPVFLQSLSSLVPGKENVLLIHSDIESFERPDLYGSFDSIISIQVFEHIENDEETIARASHYLRPGGKIILQVPAMEWLFGHWDKQIGHFRRYTKKDAIRLAKAGSMKIVQTFYFNLPGTIAWYINFCLLKKDFREKEGAKSLGKQGIFFDKWIVPLISTCEKIFHPPFGIGLQIVMEKL